LFWEESAAEKENSFLAAGSGRGREPREDAQKKKARKAGPQKGEKKGGNSDPLIFALIQRKKN